MTQTTALSEHQKHLSAIQQNLPSRTDQLLSLYQTSSQHDERICAMAKIKNQIISALTEFSYTPPSPQTSHAVEQLFYHAVVRFIKRWRGRSEDELVEGRLFSHVAGLAIKYYFREQAFRCLIGQLTELLDGHSQRIKPVLSLFSQIIGAIEYSEREAAGTRFRCLFQRHFTGQHLNSMLILANFCIQKGVIRDGYAIQEAVADQAFQIRAPEDTLLAAFKLLRTILCFDWLGQKYNDFEETAQSTCIVIPTKGAKQSALTQFEKWLKNSEWVRLYELLLLKCKSIELKLQVIELIGDMTRIHMKFFKNKNNFKLHIQNITYCFCSIISEIQLNRNSEESITLGISLGRNLNKLTTNGVSSILFEINTNFFKGLLQNIKKFIVQQIIAEQIFNSNLILYFFKFIEGVLIKSRFQKTMTRFEEIQQKVREICRNYQHYIRMLFNRIIKNPYRKSQPSYYRMDCSRLKENIRNYDTKQLAIYFLPFRMMKPRYASTNTIQELFVYVTARVMRALGLLQYFKLIQWQRDLSYQIIVQSMQKIAEWFSFTSYRKLYQERQRQSSTAKELSDLPTIREMYEQEIENEEQYCHFLRLISFIILEQFIEQKPIFYSTVGGSLLKMVGLTLQLCFGADLQQTENSELKDQSLKLRIQIELQVCEQLCLKVLLKQYESILSQLSSSHKQYWNYQYIYSSGQLGYLESGYNTQKIHLLQVLLQYYGNSQQKLDKKVLVKIWFLLYCSFLDYDTEKLINFNFTLQEYCIIAEYLCSTPILLALAKSNYPKITLFLQHLLFFLGQNAQKTQELVHYFACLRQIGSMGIENFSEEAFNKLFVALRCFLPFLCDIQTMSDNFLQELQFISQKMFLVSQEKDFVQLGEEIMQMLTKKSKLQRTDMETTCLSITIPEIQEINQGEPTKRRQTQKSANKAHCQPEINGEISDNKNPDLKNQTQPIPSQVQLYSGYHRQKTLQVLNRYVEPEVHNSHQRQISYQQSNLNNNYKEEILNLDQDRRQNPTESFTPMEIEEKKLDQIDFRGCLKEILKNQNESEHQITHLNTAESHDSKQQTTEEDLIPFANEEELDKVNQRLTDFKEIQYINVDDFGESTQINVIEGQRIERSTQKEEKYQNKDNIAIESGVEQANSPQYDDSNQKSTEYEEKIVIDFIGKQVEIQKHIDSVQQTKQTNHENHQEFNQSQNLSISKSSQKRQLQRLKDQIDAVERPDNPQFGTTVDQEECLKSTKKQQQPKLPESTSKRKLLLSSYSSSESENKTEKHQQMISPTVCEKGE